MTDVLIDPTFPQIPEVRNGFDARWNHVDPLERAAAYLLVKRKQAWPGPCLPQGESHVAISYTWQIPREWYSGDIVARGFYFTANTTDIVDIELADGASTETMVVGGTATNGASAAVEFELPLVWSAAGASGDYASPIDVVLTFTPSNEDGDVTARVSPVSVCLFPVELNMVAQ